jgi:hypothetical protein
MPYLPQNRYEGNLFTNGEEYLVASTGVEYIGYYYKTYNGQYYTGRNPQVTPSIKLIPYTSQGYKGNDYGGFFNQDSAKYTFIRKKTDIDGVIYNDELPHPRYPTPTLDDYELGEFLRYFLVKRNEPLFIEILKEDYDNIKRDKTSYKYLLYSPFTFNWVLTGNPQQVYDTNRNIILLTEREKGVLKLSQHITNYTQFYSLYTNGEEYVYEDGTPYKGLYHKMPNGIFMTGKTHSKYKKSKILYPVNNTPFELKVGNY